MTFDWQTGYKLRVGITRRTVIIGLSAWAFAFVVALACRLDPGRFAMPVGTLALSLGAGAAATLVPSKRYLLLPGERRHTLFIFLTAWFAGIYAPITAVAANAALFSWRTQHEARTESQILAPYLAPAVEHLCSSHFAGAIVLLCFAYLLIGRDLRTNQQIHMQLRWPDALFGIVTWLVAAVGLLIALADKWHWIGITTGALLISVLYASIRNQWRVLLQAPPTIQPQGLPHSVAWTLVSSLWLGYAAGWLAGELSHASTEFRVVLLAFGSILPWLVFKLMTRKFDKTLTQPSSDSVKFAVRCGFWSGVAIIFVIGGLVLTGMANSLLEKSIAIPGGLHTPFALTVIALKPLYKLWLFPSALAYTGGFVVAALLPPTTPATHRILASAIGGAVGCAVSGLTLVLSAFNLALVCVPLMPVGEPLSGTVAGYFVQNGWYKLGLWGSGAVIATVIGGALLWAMEASLVCGGVWLWRHFTSQAKLPVPATTESARP